MTTPHPSQGPIRVILVDDSQICRHQLTEILQVDGQIVVVGQGSRGEDALRLLERHQPDMLVVDLVMPGQGGQETIAAVMARHPLPILVLTAQPEGVRQVAVFDAIRRGALDLAEKPRRGDRDAEERLRRCIRTLAHIPVVRHVAGNLSPLQQRPAAIAAKSNLSNDARRFRERAQERNQGSGPPERSVESTIEDSSPAPVRRSSWPKTSTQADRDVAGVFTIGIGASAGGPTPLATLLSCLPRDFSGAIAVVQHLPVGFTDAFAEYLRGRIALSVKKVEGHEPLRPGVVYLSADNHHLVALSNGHIGVSTIPAVEGHRPSVDVLFESLARIHGRRSVGIILSGIGQDGVRGLLAMRDQGALTLAQNEESCAVYGMPQAALNFGAAQHVMNPEAMASELMRQAALQPARKAVQ